MVLPMFHMGWCGVLSGVICLFAHPGVIVIFAFMVTLWRGGGFEGTSVAGCCVLSLRCGGSGVCSALVSCAGGGDCSCGTSMLNMADSCFIYAVFFSRLLDGGLWG